MQNAAIVPPAVNRILDIGSGNGFFADEARSVFPAAEYFAIEPSANCAEHLRNRKVKLLAVDVDSDWDLSCSFTFELVNMRHVLEHFADPLKVLLKVRNVLSDDGRVYIAVPNSMNPGLPLIRYFVRAVHTFYFNRKTLEALCRKAGLKPLLTIEGDNFNKHELVMVCAKGEVSVEPVNTYREQLEVFRKYIDHETTWHYRLRSLFRRAFNVSSVAGDD
jgi:SAM-dependent methyltransferase